ncbi:hypothetical protein BN938_2194 [Mucinivorans hirudinis]|uniref:Uncharacterized protein n=1 Tax=Mucinivorans hirudinis TaxID=1433126 RepID=A0A060R9G9_9BACT|nr:hypothetical protein BN938_2194 [Mucinivorans hirudinis]
MTNSFSVQVKYRKINELRNELKMLKTTQVTTEAQRTALTRQQEIERRLAARGIALSDKGDPPITIW